MRDQIQERLGQRIVEEVERWNDLGIDTLTGYGVELSPAEAQAQESHMATLAARSCSNG